MIEFQNITKSYRTNQGRHYVFRNLSLSVPPKKNVAIIGRNGAGKSTLVRLLSGLDALDSGRIITDKNISWPVGLSGGFQGALTGRQNAKFVLRVHGVKDERLRETLDFVEDFAEIGRHFDLPVNTYSSGMRSRLGFGLSLAFDFDYFLVDEAMSVGDSHFKRKASEAFKSRTKTANLILVTHGMKQVSYLCDIVLLVDNGTVKLFDDVQEGIKSYTDP